MGPKYLLTKPSFCSILLSMDSKKRLKIAYAVIGLCYGVVLIAAYYNLPLYELLLLLTMALIGPRLAQWVGGQKPRK